jgi:MerR family transcriptional regulator, light-induced transcriptional regulator
MATGEGLWRIGELSRRTGVSAATLRAWEDRYGLLRPTRSAGNYRLYGPADEERVRHVRALVAQGASTAEAARRVLESGALTAGPADRGLAALRDDLLAAFEDLDDIRVQAMLDRLFALVSPETAIREVVLPCLHAIGERWATARIGVGEEHYASGQIQARLEQLTGGWRTRGGAVAVLACPPGEQHGIGLLCLGLAMRARGWRVVHLGPDTPIGALERCAVRAGARAVVLAATMPEHLAELDAPLSLPAGAQLALGGPAATPAAARRLGALLLEGDPLDAADQLTGPPAV